jgi:hypothetical protein
MCFISCALCGASLKLGSLCERTFYGRHTHSGVSLTSSCCERVSDTSVPHRPLLLFASCLDVQLLLVFEGCCSLGLPELPLVGWPFYPLAFALRPEMRPPGRGSWPKPLGSRSPANLTTCRSLACLVLYLAQQAGFSALPVEVPRHCNTKPRAGPADPLIR